MRLWGWLTGGAGGRVLRTHCAVCARTAAEARLRKDRGGRVLVYQGIVAGTGAGGARVSEGRARAIARAFERPFRTQNFDSAELHDHAGVCSQCGEPYCWVHWGQPIGGGGRCPRGHFQSLDPHFAPDWNEDA
jgi:bacterioferritin-associated ferredoxin